MVPSLSAHNLECVKIGKDFMFSHGYIKRDFDVDQWARPEFLEKAFEEVLKEEWAVKELEQAPPRAARSRSRASGWDSAAERRAVHGSPSSDRAPDLSSRRIARRNDDDSVRQQR